MRINYYSQKLQFFFNVITFTNIIIIIISDASMMGYNWQSDDVGHQTDDSLQDQADD